MAEFENIERDREANEGLRYEDWWERRQRDDDRDDDSVLGCCPHGVNLDREFCPEGCRV